METYKSNLDEELITGIDLGCGMDPMELEVLYFDNEENYCKENPVFKQHIENCNMCKQYISRHNNLPEEVKNWEATPEFINKTLEKVDAVAKARKKE